MQTLWKSYKQGLKNEHGKVKWEIGKWQQQTGTIQTCKNGFHASSRAIDAMRYVNCEVLAIVEVKGKKDEEKDKSAHEYMRIKKAYIWKKGDSIALAIYAAELVIGVYEKKFPNDDRPRKAIEAAKAYLENPTGAADAAAYAAAYAAYAAADAAAYAAADAADAAAYAAYAAAYAAADAAADAGKILDQCEAFIQKRIKTLEEIKQ